MNLHSNYFPHFMEKKNVSLNWFFQKYSFSFRMFYDRFRKWQHVWHKMNLRRTVLFTWFFFHYCPNAYFMVIQSIQPGLVHLNYYLIMQLDGNDMYTLTIRQTRWTTHKASMAKSQRRTRTQKIQTINQTSHPIIVSAARFSDTIDLVRTVCWYEHLLKALAIGMHICTEMSNHVWSHRLPLHRRFHFGIKSFAVSSHCWTWNLIRNESVAKRYAWPFAHSFI